MRREVCVAFAFFAQAFAFFGGTLPSWAWQAFMEKDEDNEEKDKDKSDKEQKEQASASVFRQGLVEWFCLLIECHIILI